MKDSTFKHFNPMALREKYSVNSVKKRNNYSSFWMDSDWDTRNTSIFDDDEEVNTKPKTDLVALAGYRRAISNFVTIVTGESDIKVIFNSNDDSYTDGKTVTIGSKLDDKLFDPSVGLALHEASHCVLTDFKVLKKLSNVILSNDEYKHLFPNKDHVFLMTNFMEDRRIDNFVYNSAPGYKVYYESMYESSFFNENINKGLKSNQYRTETWESYLFRIINIFNPNSDLDALHNYVKYII